MLNLPFKFQIVNYTILCGKIDDTERKTSIHIRNINIITSYKYAYYNIVRKLTHGCNVSRENQFSISDTHTHTHRNPFELIIG